MKSAFLCPWKIACRRQPEMQQLLQQLSTFETYFILDLKGVHKLDKREWLRPAPYNQMLFYDFRTKLVLKNVKNFFGVSESNLRLSTSNGITSN